MTTELEEHHSDAAAIIDALNERQAAHLNRAHSIMERLRNIQGAVPVAAVTDPDNGLEGVVSLEKYLPTPVRHRGFRRLDSVADLGKYIKCFDTHPIHCFADRSGLAITAVFNPPTNEQPGWNDTGACVKLHVHRALAAWQQVNRKFMPQAAFADFIEDRLPDVIEPTSSQLLSLVSNLHVTKSEVFESACMLKSGDIQIITTGATQEKTTVPTGFTIRVRVFDGASEQMVEIRARLRYRIVAKGDAGKGMEWAFILDDIEELIDIAFTLEVETFQDAIPVEFPLFMGSATAKSE